MPSRSMEKLENFRQFWALKGYGHQPLARDMEGFRVNSMNTKTIGSTQAYRRVSVRVTLLPAMPSPGS